MTAVGSERTSTAAVSTPADASAVMTVAPSCVVADGAEICGLEAAAGQSDRDVDGAATDLCDLHRAEIAIDAVVADAGHAHGHVAPPSASTCRPMYARSSRSSMPRMKVE